MRTSILPGLLDNVILNQSRGNTALRLFEVGRTLRENGGKLYEHLSVGLVITSDAPSQWRAAATVDFYDTSALMLDLLRLAGVKIESNRLAPFKAAGVWQDGQCAGFSSGVFDARCGLLDLAMTQKLGIKDAVYAVEVRFQPIFLEKSVQGGLVSKYKPLSLQPAAMRDIALVAPSATPSATVGEALRKAAQKAVEGADYALESIRLFDLYQGKGLPEGAKSLAYTLTFRSPARTLTDAEVNVTFENTRKLVAEAGFPVRS